MSKQVFYIGDIHGRADLLEPLLNEIASFYENSRSSPQVVFLGDVVDRGKESRKALDLISEAITKWPGSKLLLGNHDDLFLDFIKKASFDNDARHWVNELGGYNTCRSYSFDDHFGDVCSFIKSHYPHHLSMLENAPLFHQQGPFVACHAGVRRGLPIEMQKKDDLLWIREDFLDWAHPGFTPIIHGHSIEADMPLIFENRINLDTGAYASGRLSAMFVDEENKSLRFFQSTAEGVKEVAPVLVNRGFGTILDRLDELFEASA